jgi:transaldolase
VVIEELLFQGVNVNVTLLFSVARYETVAHAYLRAMERRRAAGTPIDRIASVASFFLSRIDVLVDQLLRHRIVPGRLPKTGPDPTGLLGKSAVANAKLACQSYRRIFTGERWRPLAAERARTQRLLWASTGTKDPNYSDLLYVEPLIGPNTVNTMPEKTIGAFVDHGTVRDTVEDHIDAARQVIAGLGHLSIDFGCCAMQLENEGIQKFIEPYDALMQYIAKVLEGSL